MGIGFSLFLIVVGAIMRYAVNVTSTNGFNVHTAGVIGMIVGIVGLFASLIIWGMPGYGASRSSRTRTVDGPEGTVREVENTRAY